MVDFASVEPLETQARQAEDQALATASAGYNLPSQLRSAISERFTNSPIVQQRGSALETFLTSPDRARAAVADKVNSGIILSPTQQQSVVAGQRAADVVPLASLNDLMQSQFGSIGDLVTAGTGAYQAQATAQQGAAQLARERVNSTLKQLYDQAQLELEQQKLTASNAPSTIETLLTNLLLGGQGAGASATGATQGEAKPTNIPSADFVARVQQSGGQVNSPNGQWTFLGTDWVPSQAEIGTQAIDDQSGDQYTFTESGWQPAAKQPGFLQQLFGGLSSGGAG